MPKPDVVSEADSDSTTCTDTEPVSASVDPKLGAEVEEWESGSSDREKPENNEACEAVMKQYGNRFAQMRQGDTRPFVRQAFAWQLPECEDGPSDGRQAPVRSVRAELEQDLGLEAGTLDVQQEAEEGPGAGPLEGAEVAAPKRLMPTFGYAGSLAKDPPYARFDIRDHVCMRVGGFKHGQVVRDQEGREFIAVGVKRAEGVPLLWFQPRDLRRPAAGAFPGALAADLRARLAPVQRAGEGPARLRLSVRLKEAAPKDFRTAECSDGEELVLCQHCHLPIGDFAYAGEAKQGAVVHGECMAQRMLRDFKEEEEEHREEAAAEKRSRRMEYDIGWKVARVPKNMGPAKMLGCSPVPRGMCCLVYDEAANSIRVSPAVEPAASVNLEYLSIALQVRLREGREPRFSLDPVSPGEHGTMQFKRFEPEWLAGTSAGEILFQADYHLKELSMGASEQPVVGMKSCFDLSEEDGHDKEWSAREWFVVRKAEVHLSEDDVLIPFIRMGVEAREQLIGPDGCLEDCQITRPDHALVKYADAFTKNFDLIAERRSVFYHLRELAKATILAKFLVDSDVWMDEAWLSLPGDVQGSGHLEIPQLWNERCHSQIRMQDGAIMNAEKGFGSDVHSVYGGVDFGLGRFRLTAAQRPAGVLTAAMATPPHVRPHSLGVPAGFEPKQVRGGPLAKPP
eukprot:CAMPEP_0168394328 /NCGR_PEP_ID=MMETSP0228-20121227/19475_1 /TAXON_ID=133427 /ORGANISM="Protoceratium reticulatum, Strain CCCM 535 (=CCMP 1889)" /LENGTH=680 /DNA_ID=CAMNT_0008407733 /DNA_START=53 /DNA_END=2092 /DNA_ORIENTATION=+